MNKTLIDTLVEMVKDNSNIYWADDDGKIRRLVIQSYNYFLRFNDGETLNFSEYDQIAELIVERARYSLNNSLDLFEVNFAREIRAVIMDIAIEKDRG